MKPPPILGLPEEHPACQLIIFDKSPMKSRRSQSQSVFAFGEIQAAVHP
jgi:hypothetical protein